MTRKEEIKQAAKANASQMCNFCLDKYCMEMGLTCPNLNESVIAFTDGVEWADQHPKIERLWHDASEVPQENEYVLIQDEENDYDVVLTQSADEWNTWCGTCKIIRWAYISDLLPKGGEK